MRTLLPCELVNAVLIVSFLRVGRWPDAAIMQVRAAEGMQVEHAYFAFSSNISALMHNDKQPTMMFR